MHQAFGLFVMHCFCKFPPTMETHFFLALNSIEGCTVEPYICAGVANNHVCTAGLQFKHFFLPVLMMGRCFPCLCLPGRSQSGLLVWLEETGNVLGLPCRHGIRWPRSGQPKFVAGATWEQLHSSVCELVKTNKIEHIKQKLNTEKHILTKGKQIRTCPVVPTIGRQQQGHWHAAHWSPWWCTGSSFNLLSSCQFLKWTMEWSLDSVMQVIPAVTPLGWQAQAIVRAKRKSHFNAYQIVLNTILIKLPWCSE